VILIQSQRVFTPEEYASMGYIQRDDFDLSMFKTGSYSSFYTLDINFLNLPIYRADTKSEFAFDALSLAGALATGGWTSGLKFAASKLQSD